MKKSSRWRILVICFVLMHVPFVTTGAYVLSTDLTDQTAFMTISFLSTLAAAILLLWYVRRILVGQIGGATA